MDAQKLLCVIVLIGMVVTSGNAQNPKCLRNKTLEQSGLDLQNLYKPSDSSFARISHPCLRDCTNSAPMKCEYKFHVEWYYTMAKACYNCPCNQTDCSREQCVPADGVPRPIIVVNRTLPGPAIEVCEGDEVIVNTVNHMDNAEAITLHWHGLKQKGNQYMDGVFMVSQCPIQVRDVFRYNFTADRSGTHWWHAHTGMHRADGLFGALIIRKPKADDLHSSLYDYDLSEHKVIINDWLHEATVGIYLNHHFRGTDDEPLSILINGKGASAVYGKSESSSTTTPLEVYQVEQGMRYRFRVISSGITNCPVKVWVEGHKLTLISSDGDDFQPLEVDAFYLYGGERYDFVLNASKTIGNYWLKAKGYKQGTGLVGLAVVRYQGAPRVVPATDPSEDRLGMVYQDMIQSYSAPDNVTTVNELKSMEPALQKNKSFRRVYLPLDLKWMNNPMFNDPDLYPLGSEGPGWGEFLLPQVNRRTFTFTDFPLLSQFDDERAANGDYDDILCEVEQPGFEKCATEFCACLQYIKAELGQTLEIVLIDESTSPFDIEHPFHLHGHAFRILAQGHIGDVTNKEEVIQLDENGGIKRNNYDPPVKDTVTVPSGGYTVIEFIADNPGWWILHCHMEYHLEDGMGILIRVGNQSDLPPVPAGFPRCGNYPPASLIAAPLAAVENFSGPIFIAFIVAIVLLVLIILALVAVIIYRGRHGSDGKGRHQQVPMNDRN